jgi:lipopolysaccharide export system protein LptA
VERLAALGDARLLLRDAGGERTITGDDVEVSFAGDRLRRLRFEGRPAVLLQRAGGLPGAQERRFEARSGDLEFGDDGRPRSGRAGGGALVRFGDYRAVGREMAIEKDGALIVLEGQASLETPGRISHGERIEYDRAGATVAVVENQHTIVTDPGRDSGLGDFAAGSEPILISAERLDIDLESRVATYSSPTGRGRPDLRQGDVGLRGDVLSVHEASGDLVAEGGVESKVRLAQPGERPRDPGEGLFDPTALITGTSASFRYLRDDRLLRYAGDVALEQGGMSLVAEEVEVGLKADGSEVDYLQARGQAYYEGTDVQAEGDLIDYRQTERLVRVEGGRRPARAVRAGGSLATGAMLELRLDEEGIRITAPHGGRMRGVSTLALGDQAP